MEKNRTTFIIGAGAPLDLVLPKSVIKPTTYNITQEVIKPYRNTLNKGEDINVVKDVYNVLTKRYPIGFNNAFSEKKPKPNVNFEHLFHVLEMLCSYGAVWKDKCHNPYTYPPFAPFTQAYRKFKFDYVQISVIVLNEFIKRITDIVDMYDSEFRTNIEKHWWYRDFFAHFGSNCDFFNLNYDTTIETSIGKYEDGYESDGIQETFQRFNPRKLFENKQNLSTINHLHGCINYYFSTYKDVNQDVYTYLTSDLFKYRDYNAVKMHNIGKSQPTNQAGEINCSTSIITGLHKTDKLNHIPFDFYHSNLAHCVVNSPRLVIIGYGFGDLYCNQLIERMELLHGDKKRIVVIDKWQIPTEYRKWHGGCFLPHNMGMFLAREMKGESHNDAVAQLYRNEDKNTEALYSENGCVMVLPNGFRHATSALEKIEEFLNDNKSHCGKYCTKTNIFF